GDEHEFQLLPIAADVDDDDESPARDAAGRFADCFRSQAWKQSVVVNAEFLGNRFGNENPLSVRNAILTRIGSDQQHFGWLVALERLSPVGVPFQSRSSEAEFGTHEATLMETAAVMLATHAANCQLFAEQEQTLVGVVRAMVNALDARDPYTRGHSHRVAQIGHCVARELGLNEDEADDVYLAGLLHDIGKIGVPDFVLLKNGPLTADERRQIEQHTVIGHSILSPVRQLSHVLPGVLHHHERMDGNGYPKRLRDDEIPLAGRILAVADSFDAMTTSRPYRTAMATAEAEKILIQGAGGQWDQTVLDAFFAVMPDVRRIYERDAAQCTKTHQSILQYGRFEDECQGKLMQRLAAGAAAE
ncbi:MAG: HD-GYP domain-containing protein, partial [Planctomycetaceae bacterium]|nr:HD-GYP domain-containing protein [Planctomycetaceae bacterium]